jgi:hypothetical protein
MRSLVRALSAAAPAWFLLCVAAAAAAAGGGHCAASDVRDCDVLAAGQCLLRLGRATHSGKRNSCQ